MSDFNIHWKGYPHHHLPRIRFASRRHLSTQNRSIARTTTENTLIPPSDLVVAKERKKGLSQLRFRTRRTRNSRRSSGSATRARRRASVRARQNIQVFGWHSPVAELANRTGSDPQVVFRDPRTRTGTNLNLTDGAGSSNIRQTRGTRSNKGKPESRDSFVPLSKTPSQKLVRVPKAEALVRPSETANKRNPYYGSLALTQSRAFDPRIDPKLEAERRANSNPSPSNPPVPHPTTVATRASGSSKKTFGTPAFWEAVNTVVLQSYTNGSKETIKSIVQSILSDTSSRTPSQKRAIRKFTKELKLHLQATRSLPNQSLVASPSGTTISANTIEEFKPYHSEFRSAGLAVTSEEQRGMAPPKSSRLQKVPSPPPKDGRWSRMLEISSKGDKVDRKSNTKLKVREPSFASGSTGTTVLGFTPHHEKTYGAPREALPRRGTSSDMTVLGFTPPHEITSKLLDSAVITPKKKSLPWLRKPETATKEPPSPKNISKRPTVNSEDVIKDMVVPISPKESFSSFKIVDFPSRAKTYKSQMTSTNFAPILQRSTETRCKNSKYSNKDTAEDEPTISPEQRNGATTQTDTGFSNGVKTHCVQNNCSDIATQTENEPFQTTLLGPTRNEQQPSKVFPSKPPIFSGGCQLSSPEKSENIIIESVSKPSPPSRLWWRGLNQATQTDEADDTEALEPYIIESKKSPFKSNTDLLDRNETFPFSSATVAQKGPFQATSSYRTPNKSVDGGTTRSGRPLVERSSFENTPSPPVRQAPSPPGRRTHYDCEVRHTTMQPELQPEPAPNEEPEPMPEPQPELEFEYRPPRLSHICKSRSSFQCQQCNPSRQTSAAISPPEVFPPAKPKRSRRSTRPIIPADPISYPYVLKTSYPVEEDLEVIGDYRSPDQMMKAKLVDELRDDYKNQTPVADPMKGQSLRKLKIRPAPVPQATVKQANYTTTGYRAKALPPVPPQPIIFTTTIPFADLAPTSTTLDTYPPHRREVSDKAVFKGLHVATAAACDEDVDKWIEEATGYGVREFLAQLSKFEGLGINTLASVARRAKEQRRGEVLGWEVVRDARLRATNQVAGHDEVLAVDEGERQQDREVDHRYELSQRMQYTRESKGV